MRVGEAKSAFRSRVAWALTLKHRKIRWFERPRIDFGRFGVLLGGFGVQKLSFRSRGASLGHECIVKHNVFGHFRSKVVVWVESGEGACFFPW